MSAAFSVTRVPALSRTLDAFIALAGERSWAAHLNNIARLGGSGPREAQAVRQRHAIELTLHRLRTRRPAALSVSEQSVATLAAAAADLAQTLPPAGRDRLADRLRSALRDHGTLVPLFHLMRTAALQRARGYRVHFAGLCDDASYDLLLARDGAEAEMVCDTLSAEAGRFVHRTAWSRLADRIDPDLQTWLSAHPGRYLLKMTLPDGLRAEDGDATLAALHARIQAMLRARKRREDDAAVMLRLDPLLLLASQADEQGLLSRLRHEFGHEASLAVTSGGGGMFVMAARAGRENEVAAALRRRMAVVAPMRLTGRRPGILAMFIDDTDRAEWRALRDTLELEGEARLFLTSPEARPVVAVTCTSRLEMFGLPAPDAAAEGELRFRNPAHPAARVAALAPAVLSSM